MTLGELLALAAAGESETVSAAESRCAFARATIYHLNARAWI